MTKKECDRLVRKVSRGEATEEEFELVVGTVVEEMLLDDYDATVELLLRIEREIADAPTTH